MLNSHLLKQVAWLTSKSAGALYAFREKLKKIIFLPVCFLSHHLLSKGVGLLVLMRYNGKAVFKELFLSAAQPFIKLHSSLPTPGVAGTALLREKSPCLPCRGCQPAPLCRRAQAGSVRRAAGCRPCCVCLLHTAHLERRTAALPPTSRCAQSHLPNDDSTKTASARCNMKSAREAACFLRTPAMAGSLVPACCEKRAPEVEGPGLKMNTSQLVTSSVSLTWGRL